MTDPTSLLTVADRVMLLVNALNAGDPYPVCRLCTPDGSRTWIVVSVDPADLDRLLGVCRSNNGRAVVDYFSLSAISESATKDGLSIIRDARFVPDRPFSQYVQETE